MEELIIADFEKNNQGLSIEDLKDVAGGKIDENYYYSGGEMYSKTQTLSCDHCDSQRDLYPINGGHLCGNCLKQYKELIK